MVPLLLLWPVVAAQLLDVHSEGACPSAEQVQTRVQRILGSKGRPPIEERAIVTREQASLRVVLRSADGRDVNERVLAADASCEDLAQIVAVVLATWISDVHPEFVAPLPSASPAPAIEGTSPGAALDPSSAGAGLPAATRPNDGSAPSQATPTLPPRNAVANAMPSRDSVANVPPPGEATSHGTMARRIELGLGVGFGMSGPKAAAVGSLSAAWVPALSGVGLVLSIGIASSREQPLAEGTLLWRRWPMAGGLVYRMSSGRVIIDLEGGGAFSWAHLEGRNFSTTRSANDLTFGAFASARIAGVGRLAPFAALQGYGWFARSVAYVSPQGTELDLPRYDLVVVAGAAWRP